MAVAIREGVVTIHRHRFSADQYPRMAELGILHEDDRVELIQGEIVEMTAIGLRHVYCVADLTKLVEAAAGGEALVLVQSPFRLGHDSEPQPDITVVRRSVDRSALPAPRDVLMVMEVSDSSLAYDRNVKLPQYGAVGIP